jgi:hypothetical protein
LEAITADSTSSSDVSFNSDAANALVGCRCFVLGQGFANKPCGAVIAEFGEHPLLFGVIVAQRERLRLREVDGVLTIGVGSPGTACRA